MNGSALQPIFNICMSNFLALKGSTESTGKFRGEIEWNFRCDICERSQSGIET